MAKGHYLKEIIERRRGRREKRSAGGVFSVGLSKTLLTRKNRE